MDTFISAALNDYHARERETLATESAVRADLRALGVVLVHAEYDGVGDSGQIDRISCTDASDPAQSISVGAQTYKRVETLLYALLNLRHGGWEINDGAFGSFEWNLVDGTVKHRHCQRYTDYDTSVHQGFAVGAGEVP